MFIDTHAHLYLEQFENDLTEVVQRARENNIEKVLLPNIDSDSLEPMNRICKEYPGFFYPMMGLHPCSVDDDSWEKELQLVHDELKTGNYIAVGEIGIDLYWDRSTYPIQIRAFKQQIDWALELDLPIVIHARDSFKEIFEVLNECDHSKLRGVFHCFTGNNDQLKHILKKYPGFMLGLGGVSTFKNAGMDQVIPNIPDEKIILETDAPYLAPVPFRGKRNESSYMINTAQRVADLKEVPLNKVESFTTENALNLFNKLS